MNEDDERRYEEEQRFEEEQRYEEEQQYEEEQRREEEHIKEENREENRKKRIEERYREDEEYSEEKKREEKKIVDEDEKISEQERDAAEKYRNETLKREYEGMDFFNVNVRSPFRRKNPKPKPSGRTEAFDALILGIIAIIFFFSSGTAWISIILGAIALVMAYLSQRKKYRKFWFWAGCIVAIVGFLGGIIFYLTYLFSR